MNRIKEVLEQKGIKQIWLAEKLEKSYNMVNLRRIPSTYRQQPSIKAAFVFEGDAPALIGSNLNGVMYSLVVLLKRLKE